MVKGMSCPREMRPTPMAPTLMRLLGAYCPNTVAGTMVGNPTTAAVLKLFFRKLRREIPVFRLLLMPVSKISCQSISIRDLPAHCLLFAIKTYFSVARDITRFAHL